MGLTRAKGREKNPRTIKMMRYFPFSDPVSCSLVRTFSSFLDNRTVIAFLLLSYDLSKYSRIPPSSAGGRNGHLNPPPSETVSQWQNAEKCHAELVSASNKIK
jgi:hypothetical protein